MKKFIFLIFVFILSEASSSAQSFVSTPANLKIKGFNHKKYRSKAFFSMNSSSRQWVGRVIMTPILHNKDLEDSLNAGGKPLTLLLSGTFPNGIPDLVSAAETEKSMNLEMILRVGDSVQTKLVSITVTQLSNQNLNVLESNSQNIYLGKLNFVLSLNPVRFGLHRPPFNIKNQILVEIQYGSVNKL